MVSLNIPRGWREVHPASMAGALIRRPGGVILLVLAFFILSPVSAGTLYLSGGPNLTATIAGTNEFTPGSSVALTIMVQNEGLVDIKMIRSDIVTRDDLPNTAKLMKVTLGSGDAPLTVKSDPQMIGDVTGGASKQVTFNVRIADDAQAGLYPVPLTLEYTYLYSAESEGQDNIHYYYKTEMKNITLTMKIGSQARLEVLSVTPEQLNVGTEGYLTLEVRNMGNEVARESVLKIARNGQSPILPTDGSVYVDSLTPGSSVTARFKVSVSDTAEGGHTYPLDVLLTYENIEGDTKVTDPVTFGVPVAGKVDFAIVSDPVTLNPGQKRTIEVTFQNTGAATVYDAQARLSAVDPFTSDDDTAFLGTFAPGESKVAVFAISADASATIKEYGLDAEVRFHDALDNTVISDPLKVQVNLVRGSILTGTPVILGIVLIGIIAGGYWFYQRRHKR
jgi:hypothetical protein